MDGGCPFSCSLALREMLANESAVTRTPSATRPESVVSNGTASESNLRISRYCTGPVVVSTEIRSPVVESKWTLSMAMRLSLIFGCASSVSRFTERSSAVAKLSLTAGSLNVVVESIVSGMR